jgi:hypothetical protein
MKMNRIIGIRFILIVITFLICCPVTPQDRSTPKVRSEATIDISYFKKENMSKTVVATITAKNTEGKFVPAKNARVNFYVIHGKEEELLKSVNTDNKGQSLIVLQKDLPLDEKNSFTVIAKIENDSLIDNAEEQIHFKDASLILNINPADTTRLVTAKVTEISTDRKELPVKNAVVKFYVQRLFGIMPVIEDNAITTDDKGEASFAFPKNIAGDTKGVIILVARIEDNEQFGNVENRATESWGTILAVDKTPFPRALWEPNAPIPLVITVSILFAGVWSIYFFIFYQMRKIKENKQLNAVNEQND